MYTEELKKEFQTKYDFLQLYSVVFSKADNTATITFLFDEEVNEITDNQRQELMDFFNKKLNLYSTLIIKFRKSFLDEDLIAKHTLSILSGAFKSSAGQIERNDIKVTKVGKEIGVTISTTKLVFDSLMDRGAGKFLENALAKEFIAHFIVKIVETSNKVVDTSILDEREDMANRHYNQQKTVARYNVGDVFMMFGQEITPKPEFIKNITGEKASVILAGKISNFQKRYYVKKKEKAKGENAKQSSYYTFVLNDTSGKINCTYFSSVANVVKMDKLADDSHVIIIGDVQKFNNFQTCYIRALGLCDLNMKIENEEEKQVPLQDIEYISLKEFVKPYVEKHQDNLFDVKPAYSSFIMENDFVIYDVETTGLDTNTCEIVEIGAVKIKKGSIVETFQTLIKPKSPIPDIITRITNISNDMVEGCPGIEQVLPAFKTFCEGCVLGGYNSANYDDKVLSAQSRKLGLLFDNPTTDVILLARSKMASSNYKLSTVVKNLGIVLIGAHRALNDALATGKVLLKLNEIK